MSVSLPVRGPGRPKGYFLADGTRVPSVTTITGHFKSAQLMQWANREGLEGRQLYEKRDAAAEAGTIAHQWIEDYFHGDPLTPYPDASVETITQAEQGFGAFQEWAGQVKPRILETEVPLVSEQYRFGGTLDALAVVADRRSLLDWKTSGGTYPDYIAQISAYRQLLRERDGAELAPDRAYCLRVGKEMADFHYHSWPEQVLDLGWLWFQAAHALYKFDQQLGKVAR